MAKSDLQRVAEGLAKLADEAGAHARALRSAANAGTSLAREASSLAPVLDGTGLSSSRELRFLVGHLESASKNCERAVRSTLEIKQHGYRWVGELVGSAPNDKGLQRWANRSVTDRNTRAAKRHAILEQIFSPAAGLAVAATSAILFAALPVLAPSIAAVALGYKIASLGVHGSRAVGAFQVDLTKKEKSSEPQSVASAARAVWHAEHRRELAAEIAGNAVELALHLVPGGGVVGATVPLVSDWLHKGSAQTVREAWERWGY